MSITKFRCRRCGAFYYTTHIAPGGDFDQALWLVAKILHQEECVSVTGMKELRKMEQLQVVGGASK